MLRVRRDEPEAFAELVQCHWSRVFGRLFRWLQDRHQAEDLTQDVFLRLFRSRKRYQPRAKFSTWLYHITQNVARNAVRARRRHPWLKLASRIRVESPLPGHEVVVDTSPSVRLERTELAGVVRAAVSELGGRQRHALELQQFHQWSYAEIAADMEMSPQAAKSLLYRARNQLRSSLAPRMVER